MLVWELREDNVFFQAALPQDVLAAAPRHPIRAAQYTAGRFLLRQLASEFPIERIEIAESGRPFLSDERWQFSISHSGQFAAAMISPTNPVGIDLERITERAWRVRSKFVDETEEVVLRKMTPGLTQNELYTLAWSVKEAAFKALHQTGVDFIHDLPIETTEWQQDSWRITLGEKGSGLIVQAQLLEGVCLAYATRRWKMEIEV